MSINLFILIISTIIGLSYNIFLILSPKEKRCVYQKVKPKYIYSGKYFFTGIDETLNKVYILNNDKKIIWINSNKKEGNFNFNNNTNDSNSSEVIKKYALCFESLSSKSLTVSFDIFKTLNPSAPNNEENNDNFSSLTDDKEDDIDNNSNSNFITIDNIRDINKKVYDLRKRVDIIHSDLRSSLVRRETHLESKLILIKINLLLSC